jgi:hypothetical protein
VNRADLLETVRNDDLSWVDRGAAVDKLCLAGMTQKEVAKLTGMAPTTIGQQRKCSRELAGDARRMCQTRKINEDGCTALALAVSRDSSLNQDRVVARALEIRKARNESQPLRIGSHGRRTPEGQVTKADIALADEGRAKPQ